MPSSAVHVTIKGKPGAGKTLLAKTIMEVLEELEIQYKTYQKDTGHKSREEFTVILTDDDKKELADGLKQV